jgi:prefoldin subunit 5
VNQEQVKERLQKLHRSTIDYAVIFSGKKSGKANGHYIPGRLEIIIHNLNFVDGDGKQLEDKLMYTAIHELTHHILMTEQGQKSRRTHNQQFWETFNDLTDRAEAMGLYKTVISEDTQKLITEARDISRQIAELQRKLGAVLIALNESCEKDGLRFEDMVERKTQISKETEKVCISASRMGDLGLGADIQEAAAKEKDEEKRAAIIDAGRKGKSVIQAKKAAVPPVERDETSSLIKEKRRLERTIESLTHRLEEIEENLKSRGELKP